MRDTIISAADAEHMYKSGVNVQFMSLSGRMWIDACSGCAFKPQFQYRINPKQKKVKKTTVVDNAFILEAYKAACPEWKAKLKAKFPDLFVRPTHKVGDKFVKVADSYNGDINILARISGKVIAISIVDGREWGNSVIVDDFEQITDEEMVQIFGSSWEDGEWKKVVK